MNEKRDNIVCSNCNDEERPLKAKGYCSKCYEIVRKINLVDGWEYGKPKTIKGYRLTFSSEKQFNKVKQNVRTQLKDRLQQLHYYGSWDAHSISGHALECAFRDIARLCKCSDENLFYGSANSFDWSLNQEQKKFIYGRYIKIMKSIRWKGINWGKVYFG